MRRGDSHILRAAQTLEGIANAIALDGRVEDHEIAALDAWLQLNRGACDSYPISEAFQLVARILADGRIDERERQELHDWCETFAENGPLAVAADHAKRRLNGVLHVAASDGRLTEAELRDVRDWLMDYSEFRDEWPFSVVGDALERVLADGVVTPDEERTLLDLFGGFVERPAKLGSVEEDVPGAPWLSPDVALLEPLDNLFTPSPEIVVPGRAFCFTGHCQWRRADLEKRVESLGGRAVPRVTKALDYLVIGSCSNRLWRFASYGRKIEAVMSCRAAGMRIDIVRETDALAALGV